MRNVRYKHGVINNYDIFRNKIGQFQLLLQGELMDRFVTYNYALMLIHCYFNLLVIVFFYTRAGHRRVFRNTRGTVRD